MLLKMDLHKEYYFNIPEKQTRDDQVIIFIRPHILSFLPEIILIAVLFLAPLVILAAMALALPGGGGIIFQSRDAMNVFILSSSAYYLALCFFTLAEWINYYYDVVIVTQHHLIDIEQKTIFNRAISQLHLAHIEEVTSQITGFLATLFAFGNVVVQTAGARQNALIKNIPEPQKISHKILELHSRNLAAGRLQPPRTAREIEQLFALGEKSHN